MKAPWSGGGRKFLTVLLIAVASCVAFLNVVRLLTALPSTSRNPSVAAVDSDSSSVLLVERSVAASFVRVDPPNNPSNRRVQLVLSMDAGELTDLMEAYRLGFPREEIKYPDDGGILLHNPNVCRAGDGGKTRLRWIVFVHSAPPNALKRDLLRTTWANLTLFKKIAFRVVFLLGLPPPEKSDVQADIKAEFKKYGDLIQGNFIDSYKNLTHKAVLGLRWLSKYCTEAPYAIKADDDTFLNIFEMVQLMNANHNKPSAMICPLWKENAMPILRDPKTCMKWCVKRSELRGRTHFPQYCAGISYIVSRSLVPMLYNASRSTPFFWIDDVYVTGLLTKKLPSGVISWVDTIRHFTAKQDLAVKQYEDDKEPITYFYVHAKDPEKFRRLWKALMRRLTAQQKRMLSEDVFAEWS